MFGDNFVDFVDIMGGQYFSLSVGVLGANTELR